MLLLLLNICMAMYILLLSGQVLWISDNSEISSTNKTKLLHTTILAR